MVADRFRAVYADGAATNASVLAAGQVRARQPLRAVCVGQYLARLADLAAAEWRLDAYRLRDVDVATVAAVFG